MKTLSALFLSTILTRALFALDPVKTVEKVELKNYLGAWNELFRIPNSFQDNTPDDSSACFNTVAEYGELEGGKISVTNTCLRSKPDGSTETEVAKAVAKTVEDSGNAKLKVNFTGIAVLRWLGIGNGDYWILGLGPVAKGQYQWALVGSPSRKYGWVLSRQPQLSESELAKIFAIAKANGYEKTQFTATRR